MKVRAIATLVTALCLATGTASAQSIGVFFDLGGNDCDATVAMFTPAAYYILAGLGGPSVGGITGAEFRVDGTPGAWFPSATANPSANVTLGSPLTGGCNIAFPVCQAAGPVLLYTVNMFATSAVVNDYLSVGRHNTTPSLLCPVQVLCDAPVYTLVCVAGGVAIINGPPCTVAVEETSWSTVKGLYGN
jgi:hypothetical protein